MFDKKETSVLANDIMKLARDEIIIKFRFFNTAISGITLREDYSILSVRLEDGVLCYNPLFLLQQYKVDKDYAKKMYLHVMMHLLLSHCFSDVKTEVDIWNLAVDIAAENIINELNSERNIFVSDSRKIEELENINKKVSSMTADVIYSELINYKPDEEKINYYNRLFAMDSHECWVPKGKKHNSDFSEKWKDILRKTRTQMTTFAKSITVSENMKNNFDMTLRDRYDYRDLIKKFIMYREETALSDEEFDYVYYTYGLATYGNIPFVEPLEYKEVKKINDLVIVVDTSASCKGELIKRFINVTYDIVKDTDSIFAQTNIHIIQCDSKVQSDYIIRNKEDIEHFIDKEKISGFGGTDFRPAFEYVDNLVKNGDFTNLNGVIYFTDGYGVYPSKVPEYDVIFAFMDYDNNRKKVPAWAIEVIVKEAIKF